MPGQCVEVRWERDLNERHQSKLDIVHIDEDIVVINKPSGLLTIATDKEKRRTAYSLLSNFVKTENPENKIFIIHRIDRETSGLLMFARSEKVKQQIQKNWNATISQPTYIGVVEGEVAPHEGTITSWLTESKAFIVYSSQKQELWEESRDSLQKNYGEPVPFPCCRSIWKRAENTRSGYTCRI